MTKPPRPPAKGRSDKSKLIKAPPKAPAKAPRPVPAAAPVRGPKKGADGRVLAYQREEKAAKLVELGKAIGYTHEQIARLIGVSEDTLSRHYAEELEHGAERINAAIAANLARIASSGQDRTAVTAAIFWAKARMGWRDTAVAVDVGAVNAPAVFTFNIGNAPGAGDS